MNEKVRVRRECQKTLRSFVQQAKQSGATQEIHTQLQNNVQSLIENRKGVWASFYALHDEPSLLALEGKVPGVEFSYPKMRNENLEFRIPQNVNQFAKSENGLGVLEPEVEHSRPVNVEDVVGFLIPGVAFDRSGRRLGRGQGFYDRALQSARGLKVGVAYACQIQNEALPIEAHDQMMDFIVTENELIDPRASQSSKARGGNP